MMLKDKIKAVLREVLAFDEEHAEIIDHLTDRLVDEVLQHTMTFAIERFLLEKDTTKASINKEADAA